MPTTTLQPASSGWRAIIGSPSFSSKWLVPRLPNFVEAHPSLEVRIFASEAVTDFGTQDVDVAVRQGNRPIDPALNISLLAPLDLCAFCSPNSPLKMSASVSVLRQDDDRQTNHHIAGQRRHQQQNGATPGPKRAIRRHHGRSPPPSGCRSR